MVAIVDFFNKSGILEKIVPRKIDENNLSSLTLDLEYCKIKNDTESLTKVYLIKFIYYKVLSSPLYDLLDRGGKRWRPALCFFVAEAFSH
jgi:geranylgeranyl diphosphate synthase type 3/geranylgeranyl diphosphate synthase type I